MYLTKTKRVVYSSCSIHPEENEHVVKTILKRHPEFKLATRESVLPTWNRRTEDFTNCFLIACFIRKLSKGQGAKRPLEEGSNLDAPTQSLAKKKKKNNKKKTQ
ncbi:hypothetical protein BDF21DRAFT_461096 [Thamnidium elegans]|nr:hypothetical protein BDF21DRAFT_461096 [Thamnidium elegans]